MRFLKMVLQRCPAVACVVTKIDLQENWRRIVELDRGHLSRAGLDLPVLGVSSLLRLQPAQDAALTEESGFRPLASFLAERVKEGVQEHGMVGMRFNTIGVSDGISMGTDGMSYSLQSRDLIADSIETVMSAQWYDANISLPGCDKNMPGCLSAMGRLNRPSIMVYGGTIKAGCLPLHPKLDIVSAFQCYG